MHEASSHTLTLEPPSTVPLAALGEAVHVGSDRPILLAAGDVWIVARGQIDVFAVTVHEGEPVSARTHLFRVEASDPIFGIDTSLESPDRGFLAVGTMGSVLHRIRRDALERAASDPVHGPAVRALIARWVEILCERIAGEILPKRCQELGTGDDITLAVDTSVRSSQGVRWVKHLEGHSTLFGKDSLRVNGQGFTPIARRAWLKVVEPSRVVALDTDAIRDPGTLWAGLGNLHALVQRQTRLTGEEHATRERERIERRDSSARTRLEAACQRLALAMDPARARGVTARKNPPTEIEMRTYEDALYVASRIVGNALDVVIRPRPKVEGGPAPRDPLSAILRASRLRSRTVALRGEWYHHDSGPMLAYIAEDRRPIALIPHAKKGYTAHDVVKRTTEPVTPALAEALVPFAHTFYRPFPDHALSVKDVIRFGTLGSGRDFAVLLTMGISAALLGMIPSIATGVLFNTVIPGAARSQVFQILLILSVSAFATAAFNLVRGIALLRIESRMGGAVQAAVWDRLLSLPLPFFRPYTAGDLAVRAMSIDGIRQIVSGATVTALMGGIFSFGNFALMFWYSPAMAWRGTLLILLAIAVTISGSVLQLKPSRAVLTVQAKTSGVVLQLLSSVAKLRVAGAEAQAFAAWTRRFGEQRALQYRVRLIANWVAAFNSAYPVIAYIVIFSAALPLIRSANGVRTGDFLAFLSAFASCLTALLGTCIALLAAFNAIPMYEAARPILATLPEVDIGKTDPGVLSGDIEIQHAVFRYQKDGAPVLRDLSLRVNPGEFVALVGPSGSGKSTVLRLLLGFELMESGAIYYDGQELGGLDVQAVRRQIGVVLQSGRLTSGDIFTNIAGSALITIDEAWEAARMAGLEEDIKSMPMGMHTVISEGGGTLSGGQRQRLLIARAVVHRPRLLYFDEATSALDNRTQSIVSASLERLQATRIVVAHRLSTIERADRIVVIERGQIVQSGTYGELLRQPGLFAQLATRQLA
jgi:NHLM bacteriocin system ABC transporter ATP-binding protein